MINAKFYRQTADINFISEKNTIVERLIAEIEKTIDEAVNKGFHHCFYERNLLFKNIKVEKAVEREVVKKLREAGFKVKVRSSPMDEPGCYGNYRYYKIKW